MAETKLAIANLGPSSWSLPRSDDALDICRWNMLVGTVRFEQTDRVTRLELRAEFFAVRTVVLSEFAEEVFKHYKVRAPEANDNVCSEGILCFTGTSAAGERFIVAKIAGDVQLQVYRELPK